MAYNNGQIYVDNSVTPNIGVSIGDLQQCFAVIIEATINGQTVRRLSSDLGVNCAKRANDTFTVGGVTWQVVSRREINPWAKYKPIEYKPGSSPVVTPLTESQRASVNYGQINIPVWYGGKRLSNVVNFWLEIDTSSTNRPNDYASNPPAKWWTNQLPTTAFRLTDFSEYPVTNAHKGYFHNAEPYVGMMIGSTIEVASNGAATVTFVSGKAGVTAGLSISYSDLSVMQGRSYQNLYFGAVIVIGSTYYLFTQETTVGEIATEGNTLWSLGPTIHFTVKPETDCGSIATNNSVAKVFPVLFSSAVRYASGKSYITPASANLQGTFIALADAKQVQVNITYAEAEVITFLAWKNSSLSTRLIYYSYQLKNKSADVSHTFLVVVELLDANGNTLNSVQRTVTISGGGSASSPVDSSIDAYPGGTNYYNVATNMRVTVSLSTTGDQAVFKKTAYGSAAISSTPPFTPN